MPRRSQNNKNDVKFISEALKECDISENMPQPDIRMNNKIPPELLAKWPKTNSKVPAVFLHKQTLQVEDHVTNITKLLKQIQLQHMLGTDKVTVKTVTNNFIKFTFETFEMHKFLIAYLERYKMPYHTFGYPDTRMMRVVVRDLPTDTDLCAVKEHLQFASIPVIRIHKMHTPELDKRNAMFVLVVVPNTSEGQNILRVTHILGHAVELEPPRSKTKQCHRCQKWGHSQRFCHGEVKCVKCAGDHLSHKCSKQPNDPPKCANCNGTHTANYKKCSFCPESNKYKITQELRRGYWIARSDNLNYQLTHTGEFIGINKLNYHI